MRKIFGLIGALVIASPALAEQISGGVGGGSGGGGVSSLSTSCPVAGPLTGGVTLSNPTGRTVSGSSDTLVATDCNALVEYQNAVSTAVSLTAAATLGAGWCTNISVDTGSGAVTITSAGGNFNTTGNTTLTLAAKNSAGICVNAAGTGFNVAAGAGSSPGGTSGQLQTNNGSGGFGAVAAPSGAVVGTTDSQTLTNKSISAPQVNSGQLGVAQSPPTNTPGYRPNSIWYIPANTVVGAVSTAPSLTTAYCSPGLIGQFSNGNVTGSLSQLAVRITTIATTTLTISLAIYNNDTTVFPHRPGTKIGSTGPITYASATSFGQALIGGPFSIGPGWYWFCLQVPDTTVRYVAHLGTVGDLSPMVPMGSTTVGSLFAQTGVTGGVSTVTGISAYDTWPANMNGSTWVEVGNTAPIIGFQFSSVP